MFLLLKIRSFRNNNNGINNAIFESNQSPLKVIYSSKTNLTRLLISINFLFILAHIIRLILVISISLIFTGFSSNYSVFLTLIYSYMFTFSHIDSASAFLFIISQKNPFEKQLISIFPNVLIYKTLYRVTYFIITS